MPRLFVALAPGEGASAIASCRFSGTVRLPHTAAASRLLATFPPLPARGVVKKRYVQMKEERKTSPLRVAAYPASKDGPPENRPARQWQSDRNGQAPASADPR